MKHQYELRHFRYFNQVAKDLNFRRAAEHLFITQPGLSRTIQQLEDQLEAKLFSRSKKKVSLTPAGAYLFQQINPLFNQLSSIAEHTKRISIGETGLLKIGFVGSAMQRIIPNLLVKLHKTYPDIHTKLEELSNTRQLELLLANKLDVGFVRLEHLPNQLNRKIVFREPFSLVLPKNHWLTKRKFKNLAQLRNESFILFDSDYSKDYYDQIMDIFRAAGFLPIVDHKSVHANTIFRLVENGLGISIIPSTLQEGFNLPLKFIELQNPMAEATLTMVWKKDARSATLQHFLQQVE